MALQHLRSSTANKRPLPAGMSDGQLAINTEATSPGLFFKTSSGALVKVGPVHIGTTAPNATPAVGGETGNTAGELWLDTSLTPNELKTWSGSAWVSATGQEIPVSKLIDGSARQLLQTDAAGTGVEWTSNVDVPGTLDVTSTATFDSITSHPLGSAGAPTITFTGDINTGIYSPGADQVAISTNGTGRLFVDSSGRVGVGTSSPSYLLDLNTASTNIFRITTSSEAGAPLIVAANSNASPALDQFFVAHNGAGVNVGNARNYLALFSANTERARIDSSGRLLVGTSSQLWGGILETVQTGDNPNLNLLRFTANSTGTEFNILKSRGASAGTNTIVQDNDNLARINFKGADGSTYIDAARITAAVDGTPGANDMPGRLIFSTTADGASSPTEAMRINSAGDICVGVGFSTPGSANTNTGVGLTKTGSLFASRSAAVTANFNRNTSDGDVVSLRREGNQVGSISVTTTATAYNTSSDYRLKENVTAVTDGITRLQQLKPSRFNFIADPAKTVDGFIAHEVQTIVPEAISGEKDAVDDEGNPEYQGIDQSKLVPLLTAALQEAVAKIETLEARLTAAGL